MPVYQKRKKINKREEKGEKKYIKHFLIPGSTNYQHFLRNFNYELVVLEKFS